eukprot:CAMPEP_0117460570 /NCGR_PEP_ID=MMETSP0784-20121206/2074_1 /TAXON_ID=39447 /ORGANISM="" /LENGTH=563 /DNA_ID=CAMNT_0005254243 /DNA_START=46 /DNA_END=1738 /DNA_ORIENTATION=-
MALANSTEPAFRDFRSQIAAARLRRTVPQQLICWGSRSDGVGPSCPICAKHCFALLRNPDCGHTACEDCWVEWARANVVQCRSQCTLHSSCLHGNCSAKMDDRLLTHISSLSDAVCALDRELRAECARLVRTAREAFAQDPLLTAPGPVCHLCQKHHIVLLKNHVCGHTACEHCWSTRTEEQLEHCRSDLKTRTLCFHSGCGHPLEETLWRHVCTVSRAVRVFSKEVGTEMERLKAKAAAVLVLAARPCDAGPRCSVCGKQHLALLQNPACHHAACENCWTSFAEKQIITCESSCQLRPSCFDPLCRHAMATDIWEHSRVCSSMISTFAAERDKEVRRLMHTAGDILAWAPTPCDAGPVCGVCSEQHLALLSNPECGHIACENCWSKWIEAQLPRCRDEKQVAIRCFGEKCRIEAVASIWSHACTRSEEVGSLEDIFAWRRRLQRNTLFPAPVQVECPRDGCLGLGYRGFGTVMCFMCEHQWMEDSGETPETSMSELIAGEIMKKCPSCGEYIIKNGGCDHMTADAHMSSIGQLSGHSRRDPSHVGSAVQEMLVASLLVGRTG